MSTSVAAHPVSADSAKVLLLTPSKNSIDWLQLEAALKAHLQLIDVLLEQRTLAEGPQTKSEKEQLVRESVLDSGTVAVLLLDVAQARVGLWNTAKMGDVLWIDVATARFGSPGWCETVAVIVHSNVLALLPAAVVAVPPNDESTAAASDAVGESNLSALPPQSVKPPQPTISRQSPSSVRLGGEAVYAPFWPSDHQVPVHRLGLSIQLRLMSFLSVGVGADLGGRKTILGVAQQQRWVFRFQGFQLFLGAGWVQRRWSVTPRVGLLLQRVDFDDTLALEHPTSGQAQWVLGGRAALQIGVRLVYRIWLVAGGGVDLFTDSLHYTVADQTVLRIRRFAPFAQAGFAVLFALGRGE